MFRAVGCVNMPPFSAFKEMTDAVLYFVGGQSLIVLYSLVAKHQFSLFCSTAFCCAGSEQSQNWMKTTECIKGRALIKGF